MAGEPPRQRRHRARGPRRADHAAMPAGQHRIHLRQTVLDGLVDQPYQARLTDGMIRCYVSGRRVAGFGHQMVRALAPPEAGPATPNNEHPKPISPGPALS